MCRVLHKRVSTWDEPGRIDLESTFERWRQLPEGGSIACGVKCQTAGPCDKLEDKESNS